MADKLVNCHDQLKAALAENAALRAQVACKPNPVIVADGLNPYTELKAVAEAALDIMEVQEQRDNGDFHLHVSAFRPTWDKAISDLRHALSKGFEP
jgi:Cys-tRNA synthase (O-phospho-L-seryl-tRNA:Cys-tRNA synthase)